MGIIRNLWDGMLSAGAMVLVLAGYGVPVWYCHQAVQGGLAPQWVYAPLLVLIYLGATLALAFARKAVQGVAPLRDRRR